jgi:hypothetical protein
MITEYIKYYCEDCKRKLKSFRGFLKHYHKGHNVRIKGLLIVPTKSQKKAIPLMVGTAMTDGKAGDTILVKL